MNAGSCATIEGLYFREQTGKHLSDEKTPCSFYPLITLSNLWGIVGVRAAGKLDRSMNLLMLLIEVKMLHNVTHPSVNLNYPFCSCKTYKWTSGPCSRPVNMQRKK